MHGVLGKGSYREKAKSCAKAYIKKLVSVAGWVRNGPFDPGVVHISFGIKWEKPLSVFSLATL